MDVSKQIRILQIQTALDTGLHSTYPRRTSNISGVVSYCVTHQSTFVTMYVMQSPTRRRWSRGFFRDTVSHRVSSMHTLTLKQHH